MGKSSPACWRGTLNREREAGSRSMSQKGLFSSAVELASRIKSRGISSKELVGCVLDRIEETQSTLNAFITVNHDQALKAAIDADKMLAEDKPIGPLHGIPVSVKDIINTKGIRTTWGSRLMESNVPTSDAVAVARLKKAGAIIIGKTTTSEFAHKLLTDSPLFGVTRNPWNTDLTPGGSSGGSAVAVAAGMGPLSLATDAGASTRLPAACVGIVGLKPTLGLVPHSQVPDGFNNFIHLGVMGRTACDVALMLDTIAGEDGSDPHSIGVVPPRAVAAVNAVAQSSIPPLKIAWRPLVGNTMLDAGYAKVCEEALEVFRELGCSVDVVEETLENAEPAWRVLQQSNWAARFFANLGDVEGKLDPDFVEGIRAGGAYSGQQLLEAIYKRTQHFRTVQQWFTKYDLVLTPTASRPPLRASHKALEPITINGVDAGDMRQSWISYLNLFDLTGHPAVSIPCGFTEENLPVGLQLVGPWYADANVLRAAAAYQRVTEWHTRVPPSIV